MNDDIKFAATKAGFDYDDRDNNFYADTDATQYLNVKLIAFAKEIANICAKEAIYGNSNIVFTAETAGKVAYGRSVAAEVILKRFES